MLDDHDLARPEQVGGQEERAEGVAGGAAGVVDYVGFAEGEGEELRRGEAGVHACYYRFVSKG